MAPVIVRGQGVGTKAGTVGGSVREAGEIEKLRNIANIWQRGGSQK